MSNPQITRPCDTGVKCGVSLKKPRRDASHSATRLAALLFEELFGIGACCGG